MQIQAGMNIEGIIDLQWLRSQELTVVGAEGFVQSPYGDINIICWDLQNQQQEGSSSSA